jgi:two-component system, LytTR family, response regulator
LFAGILPNIMLRVIVIEDELRTREAVIRIIENECPEITVAGSGSNVKSGIEIINALNPDILLLDVELTDGNAFDILKKIDSHSCRIIFVTAHEEYALQAIKFSAFDYILKPFSKEELKNAVLKAKEAVLKRVTDVSITTLLNNFENKKEKKIVLKSTDDIHLVNVNDIIRCEADTSYTKFFLINGKVITNSTNLKEYDELLGNYNFFRVHHSHLVNINKVIKFRKGHAPYLLMIDGSEVPVSNRKKDHLIEKFNNL